MKDKEFSHEEKTKFVWSCLSIAGFALFLLRGDETKSEKISVIDIARKKPVQIQKMRIKFSRGLAVSIIRRWSLIPTSARAYSNNMYILVGPRIAH